MVLSDVQNMGNEVILVSSGAIAIGAQKLHMTHRPESLRMKQAAAAVGQCENMFLYDKFSSSAITTRRSRRFSSMRMISMMR